MDAASRQSCQCAPPRCEDNRLRRARPRCPRRADRHSADRGAWGRLVDRDRPDRLSARGLDVHARPAPPRDRSRGERAPGNRAGDPRDAIGDGKPRGRLRSIPGRPDVRVLDAARLRCDRRDVLGAQRGRQHRPRGNDADGGVLGRLGCRQGRLVDRRDPRRHDGWCGACTGVRVLRDSPARRSDRGRNGDQLSCARHHRVLLLPDLPRQLHLRAASRRSRPSRFPGSRACASSARHSATSV